MPGQPREIEPQRLSSRRCYARLSLTETPRGLVQLTSLGARDAWGRAVDLAPGKVLIEQLGELVGHYAGELFGIGHRHGASIIARHIMTDADGNKLDRRPRLDFLDYLAEMALEIRTGIDRERGIVDRRAVGDHHQNVPLLGPRQQAAVRPGERLAVDILLEQAFAHHEPEIAPRPAPRGVGGFVDDVAKVVEPAREGWFACIEPLLARVAALPGAGGEAEDLHLHAAALERAGENVG